MAFDSSLSEVVLFELPSASAAAKLLDRVGSERFAWQQRSPGTVVVGVLLTSDELDLAALLRTVEACLEDLGTPRIRFEVDGRAYVLDASPVGQYVA
jgi:hypothetical protein